MDFEKECSESMCLGISRKYADNRFERTESGHAITLTEDTDVMFCLSRLQSDMNNAAVSGRGMRLIIHFQSLHIHWCYGTGHGFLVSKTYLKLNYFVENSKNEKNEFLRDVEMSN